MKNAQLIEFCAGDPIPEVLSQHLTAPNKEQGRLGVLAEYFAPVDIPDFRDWVLRVLLLEDMNSHVGRQSEYFSVTGRFVAENHPYISNDHYKQTKLEIRISYDIEVPRYAALLPYGAYYSHLIHELLHTIFHLLTDTQRQDLLNAAIDAFPSSRNLWTMMAVTGMNPTWIPWTPTLEALRAVGATDETIRRRRTLDSAAPDHQLWVIDEYLAHLLADPKISSAWDQTHLPPTLRSTLAAFGYMLKA